MILIGSLRFPGHPRWQPVGSSPDVDTRLNAKVAICIGLCAEQHIIGIITYISILHNIVLGRHPQQVKFKSSAEHAAKGFGGMGCLRCRRPTAVGPVFIYAVLPDAAANKRPEASFFRAQIMVERSQNRQLIFRIHFSYFHTDPYFIHRKVPVGFHVEEGVTWPVLEGLAEAEVEFEGVVGLGVRG